MTCYILCWEFGNHHITVETNKKDFHRVIDDLSNEFKIYKTYDDIDCPNSVFYYVENYYGDMQMVGFILKNKE